MIRKSFIFFIFLGVFLASCPNPADIQRFVEDEKIKDLIENDNPNHNPEKLGLPILELEDETPVEKGDILEVVLGDSISIIITNNDIFSSILWKWNTNLLSDEETLTIDTTTHDHINKIGIFLIDIDVILETNEVPHSTFFTIEVINEK